MSDATLWWVAAGLLVGLELLTGTFYLLMLAAGLGAAAVAAHLGASQPGQMVAAALVGGGATAAWHFWRRRHPKAAPAQSNRDVNLDIGERVAVAAWNEDHTARVTYRGSSWSARFQGPGDPRPGDHLIVAIEGSRLVLAPVGQD